jgi:FdhD protein
MQPEYQSRSARMTTAMVRECEIVRVRGTQRGTQLDRAAAEEPLEIRLHGNAFAVIMRTPGADRELAAGFLLAERIVDSADDVGTIAHCVDSGVAAENVVNVQLVDAHRAEAALAGRRRVAANSSCGVCGRVTIEDLMADVGCIDSQVSVGGDVVASLPDRLRDAQAAFDETGGLHAAGLFSREGALIDVAEDVGRHNAVDKVVGRALIGERLPLGDSVLCVSGRTSFEIVQKAIRAGIPLIAAVSAPSTLAIDLAAAAGVTLIGFVRGSGFNIYTNPERVA